MKGNFNKSAIYKLSIVFCLIFFLLTLSVISFSKAKKTFSPAVFNIKVFNDQSNQSSSTASLAILNLEAKTTSQASKVQWFARIFDENIYLYKTPINTIENNVYFVLQTSYFVELIEEANNAFYKAKYLDVEGYVKRNEVQVVSTPPNTPYADNINFRIYNNSSQIMRTIPSATGGSNTQVCFLPLYTQDVQFYGILEGESAVPQRTNIWYYCKYTLDKTYYGYIYSDGCDLLTEIVQNTEECIYIDAPNFNLKNDTEELAVIKKNERNYTLIIVLISIPVGIFLLMLIKSNIILKLNKKEKAKEVKLFFDS